LFVFGVLVGVGLGGFWRLEQRRSWASSAASVLGVLASSLSWAASVLDVFGCEVLDSLASCVLCVLDFGVLCLGVGRLLSVVLRVLVLGRLGRRRVWASMATWAASVLFVFHVLGGVCLGRL
jgi:hypothetical protein